MNIKELKLGKGINLGVIDTAKFKNSYFSVNFLLPISDKNIAECNVLASVLLRGTKKHPNVSSLTKHIGMIYDPSLEVTATKTSSALVFKVGAYFLSNEYLPENDGTNVLKEVTELFSELLFDPVTENGVLSAAFTESEKKRQLDRIKAKINNKDAFALSRCSSIMLGDIPAACESLGTEEAVNAVTPQSLMATRDFILKKCPIEAVFAGHFTEKTEETVLSFLSSLTKDRANSDLIPPPTVVRPRFEAEVKDVTEDIAATQGRMVMGFSIPDQGECTAPAEVFNDIFGGSPISRLFTNVRERLQLCYYCSSAPNLNLGVMYVRSGINRENVPLARNEILSQLNDLKTPENISNEELYAAKIGIISNYNATADSLTRYASWYVNRRISGRHTDIDRCIFDIEAVDKAAVSEIARGVKLTINYFLNGVAQG